MTQQFSPFQDETLDNLLELGRCLAEQVNKITQLQFDSGLEAYREALSAARALLDVTDAEGLVKWQGSYVQPNMDRAADSARRQYEVLVETRGILADALRQSGAGATEQLRANVDRLATGAPEGLAPLFDVIRQSLARQAEAFESFGKVAEQFGEIAEANFRALNDVAAPAAKAGAGGRRKAA